MRLNARNILSAGGGGEGGLKLVKGPVTSAENASETLKCGSQ